MEIENIEMDSKDVEIEDVISSKRFSKEFIKEIRNDYNNKAVSISDLVEKCGITRNSVNNIISNKSYYNEEYTRTRQYKKLTVEIVKEIRDDYNKKHIRSSEIAKRYNITREHVNGIIANKNYYDKDYIRTRTTKLSTEVVKVIRYEYNNTDISYEDLSKKYTVNKSYVREIISNTRYYDETYTKTRLNQLNLHIAKQIRREYNGNELSFSNIKKKYNVSDTTIMKIIINKNYTDPNYKRTRFTY